MQIRRKNSHSFILGKKTFVDRIVKIDLSSNKEVPENARNEEVLLEKLK